MSEGNKDIAVPEQVIVEAQTELNEVMKIDFFKDVAEKIATKKSDAENTIIVKTDVKLYKGAKSQMSEMKSIKKSITDFKKKTKAKLRELGKHVDGVCDVHLNDITEAINILQSKLDVYEEEQNRIKAEKKAKEEEEKRKREALDGKIAEMAAKFTFVTTCEKEEQVREVIDWLAAIDYDSFGERKNEAVFQKSQIEAICKMQLKLIKVAEAEKAQQKIDEKACTFPVFAPAPKGQIETKLEEVHAEEEVQDAEVQDAETTPKEIQSEVEPEPIQENEPKIESKSEPDSDVNYGNIDEDITETEIEELPETPNVAESVTNEIPKPQTEIKETKVSETAVSQNEPDLYLDDETLDLMKSVTVYYEVKHQGSRVVAFAGISTNDELFADDASFYLVSLDNKGIERTRKFILADNE